MFKSIIYDKSETQESKGSIINNYSISPLPPLTSMTPSYNCYVDSPFPLNESDSISSSTDGSNSISPLNCPQYSSMSMSRSESTNDLNTLGFLNLPSPPPLSPPLNFRTDFDELLNSEIKVNTPLEEISLRQTPKNYKDIKILIAEDISSIQLTWQRFFTTILNVPQDNIHMAIDGETAFELIETHNLSFDLIITDLNMPGDTKTETSGEILIKNIMAHYENQAIKPIIFIQSNAPKEQIKNALAAIQPEITSEDHDKYLLLKEGGIISYENFHRIRHRIRRVISETKKTPPRLAKSKEQFLKKYPHYNLTRTNSLASLLSEIDLGPEPSHRRNISAPNFS
ncbi:MAG: hypothetical protein JWM09_214 [Francisellaceae bacterium]|nr:hypothetical protein [Francisellaceae bacterium]